MLEKNNQNLKFRNSIRNGINGLEDVLKNIEGSFVGDSDLCPLKHDFADNIYVREIFIPKGTIIVGKIHKHSHPNFLLKGKVEVITEQGRELLVAPMSIISPAGTKRALKAITDLTWVTVHVNISNTTDLKEIEKDVIADSYDDYDLYAKRKISYISKLKQGLIKRLL